MPTDAEEIKPDRFAETIPNPQTNLSGYVLKAADDRLPRLHLKERAKRIAARLKSIIPDRAPRK